MNESGQSVGKTAKFYKIAPWRIVIFHDELDLAPSKIRIKKGGGNAGHNGLKSVQAHLKTPDFWRVRIGIGHPRDQGGDKARVHSYVLKDFPKEDRNWVHELVQSGARHIDLLLDGDMPAYMSKVAADVAEVMKK